MLDCVVYHLPCNVFLYCCVECKYYVDVTYGLVHKEITHKAHPNHLFSILKSDDWFHCKFCLEGDQLINYPSVGRRAIFLYVPNLLCY